ncbi:unnamed protein product [Parascedosporium putredinis]|uniref:Uncharacterized protein n=1 Tax=Parascedosporium putredinis TaxID=1442378 RepID=A0A9P1H7V1_9PEZI|nr:unnamed protein product [Parascedosporium putredinis]CAI7998739.1 unnamed protein product [Parascedosporium putredinis]
MLPTLAKLASLLGVTAVTAKVIVIPGGDPKPYTGPAAITSIDTFFQESVKGEFTSPDTEVLLSSLEFEDITEKTGLQPSADSFLRGALQAWGQHLHLVIRPEEVWFTILVQMNFYMNTHAEEIRDLFVDHEGKEKISVEDYTWYLVLERFQYEIQDRVKTDWLLEWIQPNFTTTTESDRMTANVLMMGLMKAYFDYEGSIICGLPSVTLLGEKSDWEALYDKLDRLSEFGAEPTEYQARLRPILSRTLEQHRGRRGGWICGDPPYFLNGWLTGFWYWDASGREFARNDYGVATYDGVTYARVSIERLPVGYAQAEFTMLDFREVEKFQAMVLAGTLGKRITEGYPDGYIEAYKRAAKAKSADKKNKDDDNDEEIEVDDDPANHGTIQPSSGWLLYGPVDHERNATLPLNAELGPYRDILRVTSAPAGQ